MIMSKKGTEKPIEIFVALFVILAVALVMLQLFQGQITEQRKQLSDFEQERKVQEMQEKVQLHCQNRCTQASNNGCSLQALASLCMAGSHQVFKEGEFIDFDGDNQPSYTIEQFGGEGVCEDQLYCFTVMDSCCGQQLTIQRCSAILEQFWNSREYTPQQKAALCATFQTDSCDVVGLAVPAAEQSLAWWENQRFKALCP